MRHYTRPLFLLLAASVCSAAEPRFPEPPKPEKKVDKAPQSASVSLAAGQFYVISSPVELILLQDGPGLISFPAAARNGKSTPLTIPAELAVGYKADKTDPDTGFSTVTFSDEYVYVGKPSVGGTTKVTAIPTKAVTKDAAGKEVLRPLTRADVLTKTVEVNLGPRPPPDPDPKVDPKVDPKPDPKTDPIPPPKPADVPLNPGDGKLRVLIVYDSLNKDMTPAQREVLFGADVRKWLGDNCARDGFRIYPQKLVESDPRFSNEDKHWKDAVARRRGDLPWCVISNGKTFYEGPMPSGERAFMDKAAEYKP